MYLIFFNVCFIIYLIVTIIIIIELWDIKYTMALICLLIFLNPFKKNGVEYKFVTMN